jgi:hypothetical protein
MSDEKKSLKAGTRRVDKYLASITPYLAQGRGETRLCSYVVADLVGQPHLAAKSLISLHLPLLASRHGRGNERAVHRATGALHIPAPKVSPGLQPLGN